MSVVICHTPDCANADAAIELDLTFTDPETGQPVVADAVYCGVCSEPITDIDGSGPLERTDPAAPANPGVRVQPRPARG